MQGTITQAVDEAKDKIQSVGAKASVLADKAADLGMQYGFRVVGVLLLLVLAWICAGWIRHGVYRALHGPRLDETFVRFASNLARGVVLLLALIASLGLFGVDTTSLAALVGATGLAIGLALQGSLANIASGLLLLVIRPFVVGDTVRLGAPPGTMGRVDDIDLFGTSLDTPDNRRVFIPNSLILGGAIENLTKHSTRRAEVTVGLDQKIDQARSGEALRAAAAGVPGALPDPAADAVFVDLAGGNVNWLVSVWVKTEDLPRVRGALGAAVQRAAEELRAGSRGV